nr:arsenic resistance protein [Halobaculum salinum]
MEPHWGLNFLVVPLVAWGLTRVLPQESVILVGVFMGLLTPCIDYVIAFAELAGGNPEQITAITPALMLMQLLLLPVYLRAFMGSRVADVIEAGPFVEAFLLLIVLPSTLAWLTEVWSDRTEAEAGDRWQETMGWLPVPTMGATLFVVVASRLPHVQDSIGQVAATVPVYVGFLAVMPLLGRSAAGLVGMEVGESRGLVFTSATRNALVALPLALALPEGYRLVPAVVVTRTLVELVGMVVLTRVVPLWLLPEAPTPLSVPYA